MVNLWSCEDVHIKKIIFFLHDSCDITWERRLCQKSRHLRGAAFSPQIGASWKQVAGIKAEGAEKGWRVCGVVLDNGTSGGCGAKRKPQNGARVPLRWQRNPTKTMKINGAKSLRGEEMKRKVHLSNNSKHSGRGRDLISVRVILMRKSWLMYLDPGVDAECLFTTNLIPVDTMSTISSALPRWKWEYEAAVSRLKMNL